mmetsp:Transcript_24915/g.34836  ORF Transcript_24915/g.34836 Transcript_24915/m.34836 type:complete len:567 (-) Transcript_24915:1126-2826(-)
MSDGDNVTVTNYDVLFVRSNPQDKDGTEAATKDKYFLKEGHIGNNRFNVFVNLHQAAYIAALSNGNESECETIVEKIINIVCKQCNPNGRFLEQMESTWVDLGQGEVAKARVRDLLGPKPCPPPQQQEPQQNHHQEKQQDVNEQQQQQQQPSQMITETLPRPDMTQTGGRAAAASLPPQGQMTTATATTATPLVDEQPARDVEGTMNVVDISESPGKPVEKADDDTKRRRRGSYGRLRRTISESTLVHNLRGSFQAMSTNPDKQWKSERRFSFGRKKSAGKGLSSKDTNSIATSSNNINVVLNAAGDGLDPLETYIGNNRFRILTHMHKNNFEKSDADEREAIALDLVNTVVRHWKGSFLKPSSFPDGPFMELSNNEAAQSVLTMMGGVPNSSTTQSMEEETIMQEQQIAPPTTFDDKLVPGTTRNTMNGLHESRNPSGRSVAFHTVQDANVSLPPQQQQQIAEGKTLPTTVGPGVVPQISTPMTGESLNAISAGIDHPHMADMRSAAVESLKARKKKKDIVNKMLGRSSKSEDQNQKLVQQQQFKQQPLSSSQQLPRQQQQQQQQ